MTEQRKHTPGPWLAEDYEGAGGAEWYVVPHDHKGTIVALTGLEAEANARLIAAAPDLLEALESIRVYLSDTLSGRVNPDPATYKEWLIEGIVEARNRASAAAAKARGQS